MQPTHGRCVKHALSDKAGARCRTSRAYACAPARVQARSCCKLERVRPVFEVYVINVHSCGVDAVAVLRALGPSELAGPGATHDQLPLAAYNLTRTVRTPVMTMNQVESATVSLSALTPELLTMCSYGPEHGRRSGHAVVGRSCISGVQ
jgi:hypothetical protein